VIPDQRLLVAAFARGERAVRAWQEWSEGRDLSALDATEMRLLAPVFHNLRACGVADAEIAPVVKQMARSMWVRTRLMLREAAATVALLSAHDLDSVLLKGAALVAGGYCDAGARPMADFDLLVTPADLPRAAALLASAGWQAERPLDRRMMRYRHAVLFEKPDRGCDLHWWPLWESRDAKADARFRGDAEEATLDGVPVRIPRAEHQLLHVIVHGTRAFDATLVRWIGDALAVLRTRGAAFDWALFVEEVEARRLAYPVGESLAYLVETFDAVVPAEVIASLIARAVPRWRRRLYAPRPDLRQRPPMPYFLRYSWLAAPHETPLLGRFLRLPGNVQLALREPTLARVPLHLAQRTFRKLGKWFRRTD
jgi:hypothetical protein